MTIPGSIITLTIISGLICMFTLVAQSAAKYDISPAMVFITLGMFVACIRDIALDEPAWTSPPREIVLLLAELSLSLILFHDASTIQFSSLRAQLPARLLGIGLPLCILVTYFFIRGILPDVGVSGALFLAGALSPTDAGLGAPTILNPNVPSLVRQALNVESGLNDGIVTPLVFIALAGMESPLALFEMQDALDKGVYPFVIALAIAAVAGPLYAFMMDFADQNDLCTKEGKALSLAVLPLFVFGISKATDAIGFLAEFLCGAAFGYFCKIHHKDREMASILEAISDFLCNVVWYLAGQFLVAAFSVRFKWQWGVVAFACLVPLRMGTVFISLAYSGLDWKSQAFIAWFGPRGLATIVFVLVAVVELADHDKGHANLVDNPFLPSDLDVDLVGASLFTVVVSVFAHGLTAKPLADYLARHAKERRRKAPMEESLKQAIWNPPHALIRTRSTYSHGARHWKARQQQEEAMNLTLARVPLEVPHEDGKGGFGAEEGGETSPQL